MDIRQSIHSDHAKTLDTAGLRRQFLIEKLFTPDALQFTYSHIDRVIVGGAMPVQQTLALGTEWGKILGVSYFLERRELGSINVGGAGFVTVDGKRYDVPPESAIYIGKGAKEVTFQSVDPASPAKFYLLSAPAHKTCPTRTIALNQCATETLGDATTSNQRTIYKFLVPEVLETCQLCMGMTRLASGSVWNTMPPHTHQRRMEVYFYFRLPEHAAAFHFIGEPQETRHIVVHNEQAVITPSWSIHAGVASEAYTFIWGMCGENQVFHDMDHIAIADLR